MPADTTVSCVGQPQRGGGRQGRVRDRQDLTQSFNIGRALIAVASTTTHRTQIYLNGKLAYDWPISTGRPQLADPGRQLPEREKATRCGDAGGGALGSARYYDGLVNYAVRFTFSGDYYHSAPSVVREPGHLERQPRVRKLCRPPPR